MKRSLAVVLALGMVHALTNWAVAQETDSSATSCSVLPSSGAVKVVICPQGLDENELRIAGETACGNVVSCNAWIWDDVAKAPQETPESQSEMDAKYTNTAIAVWFNDRKGLLMARRSPE